MRWKLRWDALQQYSAAIWIRDAAPLHRDHRRAALWNRCSSCDALTLPIAQRRGTECVTCSRISNTGQSARCAAGRFSCISQRRNPAIHCRNIKWGVINSRAERLGERPPDQRGGRLIADCDSLRRERRDLRQEADKKIVNPLKLRWNRLAHCRLWSRRIEAIAPSGALSQRNRRHAARAAPQFGLPRRSGSTEQPLAIGIAAASCISTDG